MRIALLLAVMAVGILDLHPSPAAAQATRGCTFQSLSQAEKTRFQSRYRRRIRLDGQASADQWLREQVCMTPAERRARRQAGSGRSGRNCRTVSRPVTSMDGSMTVGIGRRCD